MHRSHAEQILYTGPTGIFEGAVSGKRLVLLVSAILHTCSSVVVTVHPFVRNGRMDLAMGLLDRMLQAFLGTAQPSEISWDSMCQAGQLPDEKTYVTLLRGVCTSD